MMRSPFTPPLLTDPRKRDKELTPEMMQDPYVMQVVNQLEEDAANQPPIQNPYADLESLFQTPQSVEGMKQHLTNQPRREDHQAGTGGKIVAGLAAALTGLSSGAQAGANMGKGLLENPYQKATQDWEAKGKGLEGVAKLENQGVDDKRQLFGLKETMRGNVAQESANKLKQDQLEADRKADNTRADSIFDEAVRARKIAEEDRDLTREANKIARDAAADAKGDKGDFDSEYKLRQDFEKEMKPFRKSAADRAKFDSLSGQAAQSGTAQLTMLMQHVSDIDETAAREGEVANFRKAIPFWNRVSLYFRNLKDGDIIDPTMIKQLKDASSAAEVADKEITKGIINRHKQIATSYGKNPDRSTGFSDSPSTGKSKEDIEKELREAGF